MVGGREEGGFVEQTENLTIKNVNFGVVDSFAFLSSFFSFCLL